MGSTKVPNNAPFIVKLTGCNNGQKGSEYQSEVKIVYTNSETNLQREVVGDIRGKVT